MFAKYCTDAAKAIREHIASVALEQGASFDPEHHFLDAVEPSTWWNDGSADTNDTDIDPDTHTWDTDDEPPACGPEVFST